ncbi:MAG TPA: UbiA-like polyprenyltransferase [Gemmatimonadaceae bacterium]|jgi:4-hydroxybenzoate polyprenyltransferase|nr:UbiA-like polyprenyltransferase [Gemmatimonadaceae bacterium]
MSRDSDVAAGAREGQTLRGGGTLLRHANLVRLPHTVFALPFALVGVVLASYVAPITWGAVIWVVIAFTSARFAAMGFNRIVDRDIDARNPRTRSREIPSGAMSVREASVAVTIACLVFFVCAWQLNALCLALSPLALAWVLFYSYTKRFTRWSHLVLGVGLSIAPVGGYLAITGRWSEPWWMLIALAVAVATWVGGFDILYALQDVSFDRENGLYSVPSTYGEANALGIARVLHLLTVAALTIGGIGAGAGLLYFLGVIVAAALLLYEHSLVRADDFSRLDAAFFTMNGVISIVFLGFVFTERLLR